MDNSDIESIKIKIFLKLLESDLTEEEIDRLFYRNLRAVVIEKKLKLNLSDPRVRNFFIADSFEEYQKLTNINHKEG